MTSSKGASVFVQMNCKEFTQVSDLSMVLVYNHSGYLFKLPISLGSCTECEDNTPSMALSGIIAVVANLAVFAGYKMLKKSKTKQKDREYKIAYARYMSKTDRVNEYLKENQIFYQSSLNHETRNFGLVILEAYYGLADHIY